VFVEEPKGKRDFGRLGVDGSIIFDKSERNKNEAV
jgi:hypothetical protein